MTIRVPGQKSSKAPLPPQPENTVQKKGFFAKFHNRKVSRVKSETKNQISTPKINKVNKVLKSRYAIKINLKNNHLVKIARTRLMDFENRDNDTALVSIGLGTFGTSVLGALIGGLVTIPTAGIGALPGAAIGLVAGHVAGGSVGMAFTSGSLPDKEFKGIAVPPDGLVYPHKVPLMTKLLEPPGTDDLQGKDLKSAQKQGKAIMKILRKRYPSPMNIRSLNETLKNLDKKLAELNETKDGENHEQFIRFKGYIEKYAEKAKQRAFPQVKALMDTWKTEFNKSGQQRDNANKGLEEVVDFLLKNSNAENVPALEYFLDEMKSAMAEIEGGAKDPLGRDISNIEDKEKSDNSKDSDEFMLTVGGINIFEEVNPGNDDLRLFALLKEQISNHLQELSSQATSVEASAADSSGPASGQPEADKENQRDPNL